jgi:hypothetical protein
VFLNVHRQGDAVIHVLTSAGLMLKVIVRPLESRSGDPVASANLSLKLRSSMSEEVFAEQQVYLNSAAVAAYISLNKLDKSTRYKASVSLTGSTNAGVNLIKGSSSSGLGYALALFNGYWKHQLDRGDGFSLPVFATGEVLNNGELRKIGHIADKLESTLAFTQQSDIPKFFVCIPAANLADISQDLLDRLSAWGGILIAANRLQEVLGLLLGDEYDGDPLGRWEPFKGLKSFEYEDSVRFFGRDKDVHRLYEDLKRNKGILIVSGPSGSGKSSLIKAGLLPLLKRERNNLEWTSLTPKSLTKGIFSTVLEILGVTNELTPINSTITETSLDDAVRAIETSDSDYFINIDQFEDFFTDVSSCGFLEGIDNLHSLAKRTSKLKVVFSIRNEYLSKLLESGILKSPVISNVSEKLSVEAWQEIIVKQAAFSGINFEEGLAAKIVDDASQLNGGLPMVEYVLTELYKAAISENPNSVELKKTHYDALGGLVGVIPQRAEAAVIKAKADDALLHYFFSLFVAVTSDGIPYPVSVKFGGDECGFSPILSRLIDCLIDENIIGEDFSCLSDRKIRLAHDTLFDNWSRLKKWLIEQDEFLAWKSIIDRDFKRWGKGGRPHRIRINDKGVLNQARLNLERKLIADPNLEQYVRFSLASVKKQRYLRLAAVSTFLTVAGLIYWDYNRIKTEYHTAIAEEWGVPFGLNEISEQKTKQRTSTYQLTYQRGKVRNLRLINSAGKLIADNDEKVMQWDYKYAESGFLSEVIERNQYLNQVRKLNYEFDGFGKSLVRLTQRFAVDDSINRADKNAEFQGAGTRKSNVSQILNYYDASGCKTEEQFRNHFGLPTIFNGYSQRLLACDDKNRIISERFLSTTGEQSQDSIGATERNFFYGELEELITVESRFPQKKSLRQYSYYDSHGNLTQRDLVMDSGDVFASRILELDRSGFIIKDTLQSNFLTNSDIPYHAYSVFISDAQGNIQSEKYFNQFKKPQFIEKSMHGLDRLNSGAFEVSGVNREFKDGLVKFAYHLGIEHKNSEALGCWAGYFEYDSSKNITGVMCADKSGQEILTKLPIPASRYQAELDSEGFRIGFSLQNIDRVRILEVREERDAAGRLIKQRLFSDGSPISLPIQTHETRLQYDELGNIIEISSWNEKGQRAQAQLVGFSIQKYKTDQFGRLIETSSWDEHERPVEIGDLPYKTTLTYIGSSNVVESRKHWSVNGKVVLANEKTYELPFIRLPVRPKITFENEKEVVINYSILNHQEKIKLTDKSLSLISAFRDSSVLPEAALLHLSGLDSAMYYPASNILGNLYGLGIMVEKDLDQARAYKNKQGYEKNEIALTLQATNYLRTDPQGKKDAIAFSRWQEFLKTIVEPESVRFYGDFLVDLGQISEAKAQYSKACLGGDITSCQSIADFFLEGTGNQMVDVSKAISWYKKGVALNGSNSMNRLSAIYRGDHGREWINMEMALHYSLMSWDQENSPNTADDIALIYALVGDRKESNRWRQARFDLLELHGGQESAAYKYYLAEEVLHNKGMPRNLNLALDLLLSESDASQFGPSSSQVSQLVSDVFRELLQ